MGEMSVRCHCFKIQVVVFVNAKWKVESDGKRGVLIVVLFFSRVRGGGQPTGPRQPGGKGIVPVLSDGNVNYSGTTIKRTRRWMPIECRKLETRRVERNERWSKMEKSPGMTDEGGRCTRRKKSPRRIQNQILGRAPCHRQEERCRSSGLGGGGEDGWKKGKVRKRE